MKTRICNGKGWSALRWAAMLSVLTVFCLSVAAGSKPPESNGSVPGQPFEVLQSQIDALKTRLDQLQQAGVPGYKKLETHYYGGTYAGSVYLGQANCPPGLKPLGGGGEAKAYLGEDTENPVEGVFTMVASKPHEFQCCTDGPRPYPCYGWEVQFRNDYTGSEIVWIDLITYAICAGEDMEDPGCD